MIRKKKSGSSRLLILLLAILVIAGWFFYQRQHLGSGSQLPPATAPAAGVPIGPASIRIATWNLRNFTDRPGHDLLKISQVIADNHFDVLAIQEVKGDGRSVDYLLNALGAPWRATSIGPHSPDGERGAFIYRGDHVRQIGSPRLLPGASRAVFERVPYCATFQVGGFQFELVSVHLTWGDLAQRQSESRSLAQLANQLATTSTSKHLIILGDFNEQKVRPNLHFFTALGWQTLIKEPTNLSSREIYDHILIPPALAPRVQSTGVIRFDQLLFTRRQDAVRAVSDHRPAYAQFSTAPPVQHK